MKKLACVLIVFALTSITSAAPSIFAQRGFFFAVGGGYGLNDFQLNKVPGNTADTHNYRESYIDSIPINLELGAMYSKYIGIAVFGSYNIALEGYYIDVDSGNNNRDPVVDFTAMVEVFKFNLPITDYMSMGIDVGVGAKYYSIGKDTKIPLPSLSGGYQYNPSSNGLQGITEGYMIGPAGKFNFNLHPTAEGLYMSLGALIIYGMGDFLSANLGIETYLGINGEEVRRNPWKSNMYISPFFMVGYTFGYTSGWTAVQEERKRLKNDGGRRITRRPKK